MAAGGTDDVSSGSGVDADGASGSVDLADGPTDDSGSSRRVPIWAFVLAAVAVIGIVVGAVLVATSSDGTNTYDAESQQAFIDACTAGGGAPVEPACQCIYAQIVETIPYDRFAEIDDELVAAKAAGEPFVLPAEIQALVPACQIPA